MRRLAVPGALLALSLAFPPSVDAQEGAPPAGQPADHVAEIPAEPPPEPTPGPAQEPPPGSTEDRALWRAAGELSNQLTSARWTGADMHWRIRTTKVLERLDAAARAAPENAERITAARKALAEAQVASHAALAGRWPIDPTRGCQYPQQLLGGAMETAATRDNRAQLAQARDGCTRCVGLARTTLARVQATNEALAKSLAAAEKLLPAVQPAAAKPARPAGAAPDAPPASGGK